MKRLDNLVETLKKEVETTEDLHEANKIQERITRLASGVSVLQVGGATEVEVEEKKHRFEDALRQCAALRRKAWCQVAASV